MESQAPHSFLGHTSNNAAMARVYMFLGHGGDVVLRSPYLFPVWPHQTPSHHLQLIGYVQAFRSQQCRQHCFSCIHRSRNSPVQDRDVRNSTILSETDT